MPKVSVIVPVYNVEKYLRQCIESIIHQTLQDIEIICVNDGSTDSSLSVLEEYAAQDSRIHVIDKENTGYGNSMNRGIQMAVGDYIGIVESDDFASSDMFERMWTAAEAEKVDVVKSNYIGHIDHKDYPIESLKGGIYGKVFSFLDDMRIIYRPPAIWSAIYNRKFLLDNQIMFNETPGASYQDTAFNYKVLVSANHILFLKAAFLHYRMDNPDSSVHAKGKVYCICDEFQEFYQYVSGRPVIWEQVKYILPHLQFLAYWSNYCRIDEIFKLDFLNYFADTYLKLKNQQLLQERYWSVRDWKRLQQLVGDRKDFLRLNFLQQKRESLYCAKIMDEARMAKDIVIYGAGANGQRIALYLLQYKITALLFCVSKPSTIDEIYGLPVCTLASLKRKIQDSLVLVSVENPVDQYEIIQGLDTIGCHKVIIADMLGK